MTYETTVNQEAMLRAWVRKNDTFVIVEFTLLCKNLFTRVGWPYTGKITIFYKDSWSFHLKYFLALYCFENALAIHCCILASASSLLIYFGPFLRIFSHGALAAIPRAFLAQPRSSTDKLIKVDVEERQAIKSSRDCNSFSIKWYISIFMSIYRHPIA